MADAEVQATVQASDVSETAVTDQPASAKPADVPGLGAETTPVAEEAGGQETAADEPAEEVEAEEDAEEADADTPEGAEEVPVPSSSNPTEPLKLGHKTFVKGSELVSYMRQLTATAPRYVDLNEYEYRVVLDLLLKGHPNATVKVGAGLKAIQIRSYPGGDAHSTALFVVRKDGSVEDFSYLKCAQVLFPAEVQGPQQQRAKHSANGGVHKHRGRGGRHGRGGGRGGRRGGRGRF